MYCQRITCLTVLAALLLVVASEDAIAASEVRIWEEDVTMPSYRLGPGDMNPMFYKGESYQGAQKRVYPYPLLDQVTNIREQKSFRFVFLENDYIRLSVLPEIGGRLFSALDKTNGYEMFYHQHVIKPALIGMLGAWISGGVEWCVFHHHRNTTHMPVDYALEEKADGSKTIWLGETERRHRMKWLIGLTLYPDKNYIEATVKLLNRTALPHSMLYWANVAVHVDESYQVIFPPSVQYATYHAKNNFVHWPVGAEDYQGTDYRGVDLSLWKNHPEPISFFAWDLQEDFMGGYDHGRRAGVVHVGDHNIVAGAKLWEWSPGPRGRMWDKILTDEDGPYAELMVGAYSDNQPDYSWIKPYEVREFKQHWFPVREIGGFKKANLEAVVNLELKDGKARFGFNTTSERPGARVALKTADQVLFESRADVGPGRPYTHELSVPPGTVETDLEISLSDSSGRQLISYRPTSQIYKPDLPRTVTPPRPAGEIQTIEELYLTGLRVRQIHNPSVDPNAYFEEALRRDPDDTRTNTIVGIELYRKGLYSAAETHLRRAVQRLSAEYTRPMNGEPLYYLGLALRAQGKLDGAYDSLYRASWDLAFRSAAHSQLAELYCLRRDFPTALEQIERSLSTNAVSPRARNIKSAILRRLGRKDEARRLSELNLAADPLDFWAHNELALLTTEPSRSDRLSALRRLMRDATESYLELASDYGSLGLWEEAIHVLQRPVQWQADFASTYPMVHYYLAYYHLKSGAKEQAAQSLRQAQKMPPDYCFPFRLESIDVLETAITLQPEDSRAYHYLGNLLYEIQPDRAISAWERSAQLDPGFATNQRNLGWAYFRYAQNLPEAIQAYQKAVEADPHDPRLFSELDQLAEVANLDPRKRLELLERHHETVSSSNNSFLREIMVQVIVGRYDPAIESLEHNFFHVREGGEEIHDVFVDAHLLRGLSFLEQGRKAEALAEFQRAGEYPENLSVGIPRRDPRAAQVAYLTALAYESLGDEASARAHFEKSAGQPNTGRWPESRYYQALSLQKLSRSEEAANLLEDLVSEGKRRLGAQTDIDFFAKFGERETEQSRMAFGHYLVGLGNLGRSEVDAARQAFARSAELNLSNVWAKYYVDHLRQIGGQ